MKLSFGYCFVVITFYQKRFVSWTFFLHFFILSVQVDYTIFNNKSDNKERIDSNKAIIEKEESESNGNLNNTYFKGFESWKDYVEKNYLQPLFTGNKYDEFIELKPEKKNIEEINTFLNNAIKFILKRGLLLQILDFAGEIVEDNQKINNENKKEIIDQIKKKYSKDETTINEELFNVEKNSKEDDNSKEEEKDIEENDNKTKENSNLDDFISQIIEIYYPNKSEQDEAASD